MLNSLKKTDSAVAQLLRSLPDLGTMAKEGDLVTGTLLRRTPRAVYFDLGKFGTGVVYGTELVNAREALKNLKEGDPITAKVVEAENENGYVELSLAEAGKQKSWQAVKELYEKGEELKVKIIGANAGGLMAEIENLRAFMPVSQLSNEHYPRVDDGDKNKILEELKKFIGQELTVKILDFNLRNDKLILSEKEITSANVKEKLAKYAPEQIVDGIISGVADFGAFLKFADDPEIEGLIHISELDHKLIENPKDIIKVNDQVKAKILEIKDGRVTLSLKALKEDPWQKVEERYKAGADIQGKVLRFNPFGAFVSLDPEIQGLIHVSEFGGIEEMKAKIREGETYTFHIDSVKPQEKRIVLKLKK
ncbi:MAG: S1 RNA-binding domain-containing protein [Candidatus Harrisonbacteria bacterium]|nr:S1 RNA-binding domain-containing protein [Candidatus Harrisonbacteria bacterium]